jgi:hypothetical protein
MAGKAGTVRFGMNPDEHPGPTSNDGVSKVILPYDGPYTEIHFAYNPSMKSREMGTTRGGDPGKDYVRDKREADYMSNHDGYSGGDIHLMNMDERKVLNNTVYSAKCEYAGDSENGGAPAMTSGAFD